MLMKLYTVIAILSITTSPFADAAASGFILHSEKLASVVSSNRAEVIPHSYMVVFKNGIRANDHSSWFRNLYGRDIDRNGVWVDELHNEVDGGVKHVYDLGSFQGIAGRFRPEVLDEIRRNPIVDYIELDQVAYLAETQRDAPWGLARISHRKTLTYKTRSKYKHNPNGGEGITVFVIDTGINVYHEEFQGRASWGFNALAEDMEIDDHGHGTFCASVVAGKTYGVAKKAHVVAVRVVGANGGGSASNVIAGVDFALRRHLSLKAKEGSKYKGSVVNMSLGVDRSPSIDSAVTSAIAEGLHIAVAAGNENQDACNISPAGAEPAITVGASNVRDEKAYFSNHGPCVDIFAPGVDVKSAWKGSNTTSYTASGTSASSPHVAGYIAYYLSLAPEKGSAFHSGHILPKEMKQLILEASTKDSLKDIDLRTPNLLLYNGDTPDSYYAW
ncbi:serine protease [Mortierella sp. AD094]|nr:serine protease [Mortierella sp. AD094]